MGMFFVLLLFCEFVLLCRRSVKKSAMPAKSSKLFHASAPGRMRV